ncbi:MAG: hypothetical protein F6K19_49515, partial [Cyanothece sp. SIO1E1]|nr:hypothetical protein [Cyanothece sp. SIO1E1]
MDEPQGNEVEASRVKLLEFPNGPVALNSIFYVERPPLENLIYQEVSQPGSVVQLQAPRKMGKS